MYYSEAISFPPLFTLLVFVLNADHRTGTGLRGISAERLCDSFNLCGMRSVWRLCSAISCGGCDRFEEAAAGSGAGD